MNVMRDGLPWGNELDILVAQNVLGWKRHVWLPDPHAQNWVCQRCGLIAPMGAWELYEMERWFCTKNVFQVLADDNVPAFSLMLDRAWMIVERAIDYRFSSGGGMGHSLPIGQSRAERTHIAELWFGERGEQKFRYGKGIANTLPLAICRAALAAHGGAA